MTICLIVGECAVQIDPSIILVTHDSNLISPEDLWMVSEVPLAVSNVPVILYIVSDVALVVSDVPNTVSADTNMSGWVPSIDSDVFIAVHSDLSSVASVSTFERS